jgi:hypothetical protein
VAGERRLRILSMLASQGADLTTARLCEACVEVTAVSGAGIMLKSGDAAHGSVCTRTGRSWWKVSRQGPSPRAICNCSISALTSLLVVRLKAYAFGNGRPLTEVAEDVVARRLRFDARGGGSGPAS